jgi:hypothetical protein
VAAVERGGAFASVHAIPLRLRGQAIGALARIPALRPDVAILHPDPGHHYLHRAQTR